MKKRINVSEEIRGSINRIIQSELEISCLKREVKREEEMITMGRQTAGLPEICWDLDSQAKCKNVYAMSLLTKEEFEELTGLSNYFAELIVAENMKHR